MDKDGGEPKTYVSTARLVLKRLRHDGRDGAQIRDNTVGFSPATDHRQTPVESPGPHGTLSEGSSATFQGAIAGSSPVSVSWLQNGDRLNPHESKNGVAGTTLSKRSPGDAGTLTCTVKNPSGSRPSGEELHIKETKTTCSPDDCEVMAENTDANPEKESGQGMEGPSVEFLDPPGQVEVQVGEQAQLLCEFRSTCVPVACCWIFNRDKAVLLGPRMSIISNDTHSSLVISQACPEDTGSYTVIARNRMDSAEQTVSLSVIDRPDPPASHPVVSQLSAESLVLSWTGPSYDGGTAVLGYSVEVRKEGPDSLESWTEVTRWCKNTSYQVSSGLEPRGEYRFRIRAYNSAGVSEPSQESECVTMMAKKEEEEEQKDGPEPHEALVIDTKHNVKDHYDVHEKLGVGKFGQVFRLSHKETGQVCAGKFYRAKTSKERSAAHREIDLMNCLHHPKLVQCLAAYQSRYEMVMVMEYIAGGELFQRIVDDNFEHTEPTSARYMQQILEGMQYVHKQNIIHLDLKPENIVCVDTTGTQIKIIDFGLASRLEDGKPLMVMHGTPEFAAPEVINYEPVGVETDMWSLGVICFILLSGESPFQGNSDAETFALVAAAHYEFNPESFEDISDQAKDFIGALLKKDRRCRLSCTEALVHPWMASFTQLTRRPTKTLRKEKMRHFLAKRKWKKTGKAVLALKRMSNLSNRPNSPGSFSEETSWSQEAEEAIRSLDKQLQSEPRFREPLRDTTLPEGSTAHLACRVDGYPHPDVKWLQGDKPVSESSRVSMEYQNDGFCCLVLVHLEPNDSGIYMCQASNKLGTASCSARLIVDV